MRALLFLCTYLSITYLFGQQETIFLPVTGATVYESGATVTRSVDYDLRPGISELVITNLPLDLNESTLNVHVSKDVLIMSQKVERSYNNAIAYSKNYDDELLRLNDSLELLKAYLQIIKGEERILNENIDLSLSEVGFKAEDVATLRANYASEMKAVVEARLSYSKSIRRIQLKIQTLNRQMAEEGTRLKKGSTDLRLELESPYSSKINLEISYFDPSAGWTPTYDLRVDRLTQPLNLIYKANIFQNTGEDWDSIALSLSTAVPNYDYTLPTSSPYFLTFNNYYSNLQETKKDKLSVPGIIYGRVTDDNGEPLIGASIVVNGTSEGTITDIDGQYQLRVSPGDNSLVISYVGFNSVELPITSGDHSIQLFARTELLEEVVVTGYAGDQSNVLSGRAKGVAQNSAVRSIPLSIVKAQTSLNYDIRTPAFIPSTSREKTILIRSELVEVNYKYVVYPKIDKNAYLIAAISNWPELQILVGNANIYLENKFVGQTEIGGQLSDSEVYELSLGQDRDVFVDRILTKGYSKMKLVGNNKVETRIWSLNLVNNKEDSVNLVIEDQFPISKVSDIKVDLKEYANASLDKDKGSLTWQVSLAPYEQRKLSFEYQVKAPRDRRLIVE